MGRKRQKITINLKNNLLKCLEAEEQLEEAKKGSGINFHKPSDPSFLKAFKDKVGYKEKVTSIDDKFPSTTEGARAEFEDREDHDDEKPVVVVLGDGDLTAAEAETEITGTEDKDDGAPPL